MGLETAHPEVLARLNKRMTLDQFSRAATFLRRNEIDLRVFILVQPPYMPAAEALQWAERSLDFAMEHGATAAVLIPTRAGNGVMDELILRGDGLAAAGTQGGDGRDAGHGGEGARVSRRRIDTQRQSGAEHSSGRYFSGSNHGALRRDQRRGDPIERRIVETPTHRDLGARPQ